jgi:uncharacterized membrane protein YjjB (DUF3815 family)
MFCNKIFKLQFQYYSNYLAIARYPASIAGVSIFFESPTRQMEIALFCLSKGWESAYLMLKRRGIPISLPGGNLFINGLALALIAFSFHNSP